MASENETLADIIAEVRRNAESSQMGHKSFLAPSAEYWKSLANRIDAAWSRVRGIVAELAIAVRECNGEKYHVTLLRDADAIASGETPNCPSLVQKQGGGLDNSPGNAAEMRESESVFPRGDYEAMLAALMRVESEMVRLINTEGSRVPFQPRAILDDVEHVLKNLGGAKC